MPAAEETQRRIAQLISEYEAQKAVDPNLSEANVEAAFVARLFEILGWEISNPRVWNRQVFIRGAGFADVALQIDDEPVIFLEAKRFGKVARPEATATQMGLWGDDVILALPQRQANHIDRTPEERQAIRYGMCQWVLDTAQRSLV